MAIIDLKNHFNQEKVKNYITVSVLQDSMILSEKLQAEIEAFYSQRSLTYEAISEILAELSVAYEEKFLQVMAGLTKIIKKQAKEKNNDKER